VTAARQASDLTETEAKLGGGGLGGWCRRVVPIIAVKPRGVVECDGDEPRVGVDGDEREPVATVHPVAREVDPERRLRQLRGHLLRRQRHLPRFVGVAVQAQVLLLYTDDTSNSQPASAAGRTQIKSNRRPRRGVAERSRGEGRRLTWIAQRVELLDVCEAR